MDLDLLFKMIALAIYFLAMLGIGLHAYRKTVGGDEYMLGGRQLHPFTAALSAGASDMSGWLLMGLPGALFVSGLVEAWMAVGLTIGAALNWAFVAPPRLRQYTQIAGGFDHGAELLREPAARPHAPAEDRRGPGDPGVLRVLRVLRHGCRGECSSSRCSADRIWWACWWSRA